MFPLRIFSWKQKKIDFKSRSLHFWLKYPKKLKILKLSRRTCLPQPGYYFHQDIPGSIFPTLSILNGSPSFDKLRISTCQTPKNTGILTCNPSHTPIGLCLGPINSQLINIAAKTLGFWRSDFSSDYATHTGILTSVSSSPPYSEPLLNTKRSPTIRLAPDPKLRYSF